MAKKTSKKKPTWKQYKQECSGKKNGKSQKCRDMFKTLQKIPLSKAAKVAQVRPARNVDGLIDVDHFNSNPIAFYKKMLESYAENQTYTEFKDSDRFTAIVIKSLGFNLKTDLTSLFGDLHQQYDNEFQTFRGGKIQFYQIFVPDIDKTIPLKSDKPKYNQAAIQAFLKTPDRIAIYHGKDTIGPGYLVKISGIISAGKAARIPEIIEVVSETAIVEIDREADNPQEALKACLPQLKLETPQIKPVPSPFASLAKTFPIFENKDIFSSYDSNNDPESHPKEFFVATKAPNKPVAPKEKTKAEIKRETIDRMQARLAKVDKCADLVILIPPIEPEQQEEPVTPKKNFIFINEKNEVGTDFTLKHSISGSLIYFEASDEQNSASPCQFVPVGTRDPTLIVVKEAPYLNIADYIESVKIDKQYAAHLCIDNKGTVYQFSDLNNIIKSYNPTINDMSIQIAVLNISHRNSLETNQLLKSRNGTPEYAAALSLKYLTDILKLKSFYKRKENIDKIEVSSVGLPPGFLSGKSLKEKLFTNLFLWDKELIPGYRLDITEKQKESLQELINEICNHYQTIEKQIPRGHAIDGKEDSKFLVQKVEPSISAGEFSGICCPYNFLQSSTNGVFLLNQIFKDYEQVEG